MPKPAECPTPGKVRYATTIVARQAADRDAAIHGTPHYPYPCACGWWHTSTKPYDRALGVNRNGVVYLRKPRPKTKPTGA
jgi:hypothetical protein